MFTFSVTHNVDFVGRDVRLSKRFLENIQDVCSVVHCSVSWQESCNKIKIFQTAERHTRQRKDQLPAGE